MPRCGSERPHQPPGRYPIESNAGARRVRVKDFHLEPAAAAVPLPRTRVACPANRRLSMEYWGQSILYVDRVGHSPREPWSPLGIGQRFSLDRRGMIRQHQIGTSTEMQTSGNPPAREPGPEGSRCVREPRLRAYSSTLRRRSALLTTETELNAIAAAATIGLSRMPNTG